MVIVTSASSLLHITKIITCLISPALAMIAANRGNAFWKSIALSPNWLETRSKNQAGSSVVGQLAEVWSAMHKGLALPFHLPAPTLLGVFLIFLLCSNINNSKVQLPCLLPPRTHPTWWRLSYFPATAKYSCLAFSAPPHPCLNTSASQSRF